LGAGYFGYKKLSVFLFFLLSRPWGRYPRALSATRGFFFFPPPHPYSPSLSCLFFRRDRGTGPPPPPGDFYSSLSWLVLWAGRGVFLCFLFLRLNFVPSPDLFTLFVACFSNIAGQVTFLPFWDDSFFCPFCLWTVPSRVAGHVFLQSESVPKKNRRFFFLFLWTYLFFCIGFCGLRNYDVYPFPCLFLEGRWFCNTCIKDFFLVHFPPFPLPLALPFHTAFSHAPMVRFPFAGARC